MKILFLVTSDVTVATFVVPQVRGLQERGHDVRVLSGRENQAAYGVPFTYEWHHYIACSRSLASVGDLVALTQIGRHITSFSPDLVVGATPKASLLAMVASRCLAPKVPRVHLLWGLRSETLAGIRRTLVTRMERLTMSLASAVVANSHSLADEVVAQQLASATQVQVLGEGSSHGVDLTRFRPPDEPRSSDEVFTVGFVGRVSRDKGVPELLEAVSSLVAQGKEIRVRIVGPVEDADALEGFAGLPWVCVEGPVRVEAETYWGLDVLCLPSHREGFPNVCLEAYACGVPVVVSDATGCRDAVVPGVTGVRVPAGDVAALAVALDGLACDPGRRRRLGNAGREWAERLFDEASVLDGYARFYEDAAVAARTAGVDGRSTA